MTKYHQRLFFLLSFFSIHIICPANSLLKNSSIYLQGIPGFMYKPIFLKHSVPYFPNEKIDLIETIKDKQSFYKNFKNITSLYTSFEILTLPGDHCGMVIIRREYGKLNYGSISIQTRGEWAPACILRAGLINLVIKNKTKKSMDISLPVIPGQLIVHTIYGFPEWSEHDDIEFRVESRKPKQMTTHLASKK